MIVRHSEAQWQGNLKEGSGTLKTGSGAYSGPYSFHSRFEDGPQTNPEELIAAAHAACYAMALANGLSSAGHTPTSVHAVSKVCLDFPGGAPTITKIDLECEAKVPGIDDATFQKFANETKSGCPVSKVLAAAEITLKAKLMG
jgi:osmotically inducible protein OsmC